MGTFKGITQSSLKVFSQPQPHPLLFFSKGVASKLKGLSVSSTEKTMVEVRIWRAKIAMDKARNRSKSYGFVTFAKKDDAVKACEGTNRTLLDGRAIYVGFECISAPVARTAPIGASFQGKDTWKAGTCRES